MAHSPNEASSAPTAASAGTHSHHTNGNGNGNGNSVSEASGVTLRVRRMGEDSIEFTVSRTHATLYSRTDVIGAAIIVTIIIHQIVCAYMVRTMTATTTTGTLNSENDDHNESDGGNHDSSSTSNDDMSHLIRILLCVIALAWRYASLMGAVREESLLVVDALGVQKRTLYWSGAQSHRFIDKANISQIIINEGITMCRVVFYVAIITCPTTAPDSGTKINNGINQSNNLSNRAVASSQSNASSTSSSQSAATSSSSVANGSGSASNRPKKPAVKAPHQSLVLAFDHIYPRLSLVRRVYRGSRAILYGEHYSDYNGNDHGMSDRDGAIDEPSTSIDSLAPAAASSVHQHTA